MSFHQFRVHPQKVYKFGNINISGVHSEGESSWVYNLGAVAIPVFQLLCVLEVIVVVFDGLGVVSHESERVSEAIAGLSHKGKVVYLPRHRHGRPGDSESTHTHTQSHTVTVVSQSVTHIHTHTHQQCMYAACAVYTSNP